MAQSMDPIDLAFKQVRETSDTWYGGADQPTTIAGVISAGTKVAITQSDTADQCSVSLVDFQDGETAIRLNKCGAGHHFHEACIAAALKANMKCPFCNTFYGVPRGNQPPGRMAITLQPFLLPGQLYRLPTGQVVHLQFATPLPDGYSARNPDMPYGTYMIAYQFPTGIQGPEHPNPGTPYIGTSRRAFIPASEHGLRVLHKFLRAWDARLLMTVGTSITTGRPNSVIWNGIPHKTNVNGGPAAHGFPDPNYLNDVEAALAAVGIE